MRVRILALLGAVAAMFAVALPGTAHAATGTGDEVRPQAVVEYWIEVGTSNIPNAGTDADVAVQIVGTLTRSPWLILDNPGDDRERGQVDTYGPFYLTDVGALTELRVGFTMSGDSPHWHLAYMTVDPSNRDYVVFPCYCWLTQNQTRSLWPA